MRGTQLTSVWRTTNGSVRFVEKRSEDSALPYRVAHLTTDLFTFNQLSEEFPHAQFGFVEGAAPRNRDPIDAA
jgi:hypothetical protein